MSEIREPKGTLKERWMSAPRAILMLYMLPQNSWAKIYAGLRDYVRWLLEEKKDAEALREFNSHIEEFEAY